MFELSEIGLDITSKKNEIITSIPIKIKDNPALILMFLLVFLISCIKNSQLVITYLQSP